MKSINKYLMLSDFLQNFLQNEDFSIKKVPMKSNDTYLILSDRD